jgi:hypothetical protein
MLIRVSAVQSLPLQLVFLGSYAHLYVSLSICPSIQMSVCLPVCPLVSLIDWANEPESLSLASLYTLSLRPAILANLRHGCKGLPMINTLA